MGSIRRTCAGTGTGTGAGRWLLVAGGPGEPWRGPIPSPGWSKPLREAVTVKKSPEQSVAPPDESTPSASPAHQPSSPSTQKTRARPPSYHSPLQNPPAYLFRPSLQPFALAFPSRQPFFVPVPPPQPSFSSSTSVLFSLPETTTPPVLCASCAVRLHSPLPTCPFFASSMLA